jgi:acetyltransferase-like isoleucine patch superfamily enzyme
MVGHMRGRLARLEQVATTGIRRSGRRWRLRRRHGLLNLGPTEEFQIAKDVRFGVGCRLGGPVFISGSILGDFTYVEAGVRISATTVGSYCSIAPNAMIGLAEHPTRGYVSTHPRFYRAIPAFGYDLVDTDQREELRPTTIGSDVWIGAAAVVRGGLSIGHGAVVGAGAVVTSDVAAYEIVAGVPARSLGKRFDDATVESLLELRWWDKGEAWIRAHADRMRDVDRLLASAD